MRIHAYEKIWLVAALLLIVGFVGTIVYGSVVAGVSMVGGEEGVDPNALEEDDRFADPRVERVGENEYEAYVVARQFAFQPDPIEVPENSTVTFHVTSADVIHGFQLVGTNVNTMVVPGEVATMTVEFDEAAEYGIVCHEYCGSYHHVMEGKVIVHPEDDFETDDEDDAETEVDG